MTKKFTATERERLVGAQPEVLHPLPLDPQKVRIGEREKEIELRYREKMFVTKVETE